jgi:hypothetical protein
VLGDFHLLDLLTERGTITDTVFTDNSDLLSALSLRGRRGRKEWTDEYLNSKDLWMVGGKEKNLDCVWCRVFLQWYPEKRRLAKLVEMQDDRLDLPFSFRLMMVVLQDEIFWSQRSRPETQTMPKTSAPVPLLSRHQLKLWIRCVSTATPAQPSFKSLTDCMASHMQHAWIHGINEKFQSFWVMV